MLLLFYSLLYLLVQIWKKNNKKKKNNMKEFISQTRANENGDYTITYIDFNDVLVTVHMNLFI